MIAFGPVSASRQDAEGWVRPADEQTLALAYGIFREEHLQVELLVGYEGDAFAATGDQQEAGRAHSHMATGRPTSRATRDLWGNVG